MPPHKDLLRVTTHTFILNLINLKGHLTKKYEIQNMRVLDVAGGGSPFFKILMILS